MIKTEKKITATIPTIRRIVTGKLSMNQQSEKKVMYSILILHANCLSVTCAISSWCLSNSFTALLKACVFLMFMDLMGVSIGLIDVRGITALKKKKKKKRNTSYPRDKSVYCAIEKKNPLNKGATQNCCNVFLDFCDFLFFPDQCCFTADFSSVT